MKNIGDKYYKVIDGDLDLIRIVKIINDDTSVILKGTSTKKIDNDVLKDYIKLNPDGYVFFNIVNMGATKEEGQDVIVSLNRKTDIDKGIGLPFAACRQNIYDFFSNQIQKEDSVTYLGLSMSIETTPEDVRYESILACGSMDYSERISIYIDDKLDILLRMIRDTNKFNSVLYHIHKIMKGSEYHGLCTTLKDLLEYNKFMYDFKRAFNIIPIDTIIVDEDNITANNIIDIEDVIKHRLVNFQIFKYTKTINLSKIERDYLLISDSNDALYIVIYTKGEGINRPYINNIVDKSDSINLIKHIISKEKGGA